LGIPAPNTAVPIPPNEVGPFKNFQPNSYWSGSRGRGHACPDPIANFNFATGAHGGGCGGDFLDVLPMINGKISDTLVASGTGLQPSADGKTVYDPETKVTWLADANLAATWLPDSNPPKDTLGLPLCVTAPDTTPCVALDGSMNYESAKAFINAMNHYQDPSIFDVGYLGQTNWELPPVPKKDCPLYGCLSKNSPMGELFYVQLGKSAGEPVVEPPDIEVGPFNDLQPFPYWSCQAPRIQDACEDHGPDPPIEARWGFSFGDGFLGTSDLPADHFVTVYHVGCDLHDPGLCLLAP
jgi:hypothetical protein